MNFIDLAASKAAKILERISEANNITLGFLKNSNFQRWANGIILCSILAFLLAPEIHFSAPKFRQGMIATRDIKADRDFLVEDQKSTEDKRNDVAENIKHVYDYDSKAAANIRTKLTKALSSAAEDYKNSLKEKPPDASAADISKSLKGKKSLEANWGIPLSAEEFYTLKDSKFSAELQQNLSRLISPFYERKYITNNIFSKQEKEKGITVRNIYTKTEQEIKDVSKISSTQEIDAELLKKVNALFENDYYPAKRAIFSLAKKLIDPNLTFNKETTEKKKLAAMEEVKPVLFQVQKNEMIVREGEKIGYTELIKLDAFLKSTGDTRFSSFAVLMGLFLTALFLSLILFFWRTRNWLKPSKRSNIDLVVFGIIAVIQILFVKTGIFIALAINKAFPTLSAETCYFAIPFAWGGMIIAVLINRNVAMIITVFTSFLIAFLFDEKITFPLFCFLGSVAASYNIVGSQQRSAFLRIGVFLGIINMAAIVCINFLAGNLFNDLILRLVMGFAGGILTAILVAGISPVFESLFGFITDIRLLELANLNHPLFQRMIIEAPGTYHHSIIVASLVEAAGEAIGANSLLAKVSAYYHDIGKLTKPQYFIENQTNNENKHDKLSPKMSSLIIISHVKDGCELASEVKLGQQIINIIREHHGTSIVSYFFDKAKKDKDESIRSLSENDFRYPGPKPQTKESGLVMLGDVVEASSRTLHDPTPARIRSLVRERIERVYMDGQLDECELTLRNLNTIAETFTQILTGIFHHRVDYPEYSGKETNGKKEINEFTDPKQPE